jgi:hypothetical protein
LASSVAEPENHQRDGRRGYRSDDQWEVEQDAQRHSAADHLSHVCGHRDRLGLQPIGHSPCSRQTHSELTGKRSARHDAELGGKVLHEDGHEVGQQDDPRQGEPELCPGRHIGRDVARIDVGH